MRLNSSIVAMILCFIAPASAIASGLIKGGFESGATSPGATFIALEAGSTNINGWVVGGGGIDYIGGYWQASEGSQSLNLNLKSNGSITTTLPTIPGIHYRLLFDMAGNPNGEPRVKKLRIWNDGKYQDFVFNTTGRTLRNMGWQIKSLNFTATTNATKLTFESLTTTAYGPALDNVRVIPELNLTKPPVITTPQNVAKQQNVTEQQNVTVHPNETTALSIKNTAVLNAGRSIGIRRSLAPGRLHLAGPSVSLALGRKPMCPSCKSRNVESA